MGIFATTRLFEYFPKVILPAVGATLRMLACSLTLGLLIGLCMAVVLILTSPRGLAPHAKIYKTVNFIVNAVRAFPVLILIVAISPLTKMLIGTSIGEVAAVVPLTIAAFPIITRMIESSLQEVDKDLIVAAESFGASKVQIFLKVMFVEALPSIVSGMTIMAILLLASTTVAGAVGAGGLGAIALAYGYNRFDDAIMYTIVLILFIIVLVIQGIGQFIYKRIT